MTTGQLINLAKRKNAAHKELLRARAVVRHPAGHNKMTEKDRDIDMDFRTLDQREEYENLYDEYAISFAEEYGYASSSAY